MRRRDSLLVLRERVVRDLTPGKSTVKSGNARVRPLLIVVA